MAVKITVDQKVPFSVKLTDSKGNAAVFDAKTPVVVSVSDPDKGSIANLAADGMSGELVAGNVGTAQVQIEGDADLGDGVRSLVILGDFEVVAGEAVAGTAEFGAPIPQ